MTHAEQPYLHRWSRQAYGQLIEHGVLDEDDPVELLDGLLLVKEPQSSPHRTAVLLVAKRWTARSARAGSCRRRARPSSTSGVAPLAAPSAVVRVAELLP